jgi:hypothetical protein
MTDEKTTQSRTVEPVTVTVIGTGDGSRLSSGTQATTPGAHMPNVVIQVVTPIAMMLVKGTKAFMVSWLAIMPVAGVTGIIPVHSFLELAAKAAGLSIGVGILAVGNAFVEILTKLDQKFPSWTA